MDAIEHMTDQDSRMLVEMRDELSSIRKRLDALESFADRAQGAITLAKFAASLLGFGGIAAIVWFIAQAGRVTP